jgi:hypothetical protein
MGSDQRNVLNWLDKDGFFWRLGGLKGHFAYQKPGFKRSADRKYHFGLGSEMIRRNEGEMASNQPEKRFSSGLIKSSNPRSSRTHKPHEEKKPAI